MRSNFRKTAITILLVLCMAVSMFAVSAFAEDANSTSTNADSTSVNHTCERKVVEYTATQAAKYIAGDNTYPELEGYLFAGWYNDKACTKAGLVSGGTPSGENAYALYIPEHVLSIQAQASANLMDEKQTNDAKGSLRFITSVDSLLYKQVGFEVYYTANGVTRKATSASNKVYSKLYEMDSENVWTKTPSDTFCNLSKYFKICTLKNFTMQTYMETEFTVKPYWITMDGDKVYGVEATKKFSEGCLRDTVWVSNDGKDEPNYGDYDDPYATLDYAISHVNDGGTVRVKDELTVSSATWTEHGKSITITGDEDTTDDGEVLDFSALSDLCINDAVTFENITLTLSSSRVFAEGHDLIIKDTVTITNEDATLQIFGGSVSKDVKNTYLELYAGSYKGIYGGGVKTNVTGNTKVIVGEGVNPKGDYTSHNYTYSLFGAGYSGIVYGNTEVIVEEGAIFNYVYGGGDSSSSEVKGSTNVTFAGNAMSIYGGSKNGVNVDTHVVMNGGAAYQIFGGCENTSMTGNTDVQVLGKSIVHRRVYGGCYNKTGSYYMDGITPKVDFTTTNFVTGHTSVSIGENVELKYAHTEEVDLAIFSVPVGVDNALYAISRGASAFGNETGTFIFNDTVYEDTYKGNLGYQDSAFSSSFSEQTHHYLVTTNGNKTGNTYGYVYSAGDCIRIVPEGENAATVTIDGEEKFYTAEKESYYPLPAGHDASVPIVVTFGDAKQETPSGYEAKIDSTYYKTIEEAIQAAEKMKDANIVTLDTDRKVAKITVSDAENGTVTSSCKYCIVGNSATLTAIPDEGYNCTGLSLQLNDAAPASVEDMTFVGGDYTFTPEEGEYVVEATFAEKVFVNSGDVVKGSTQTHYFKLENQYTETEAGNTTYVGSLILTKDYRRPDQVNGTGDTYDMYVNGTYADADIRLWVKDQTPSNRQFRTRVVFEFDNTSNLWVGFSLTNTSGNSDNANDYALHIQKDTLQVTPNKEYTMSPETVNKIQSDGIEFRVVRKGAIVNIFLDGEHACQYDLSKLTDGSDSNIADKKAYMKVRSYGNVGVDYEIPFSITDTVEKISVNIADSEHGTVWANGENNTDFFMGDKIKLVPKADDGYECTSLKIDGEEVERATDGTYTFTATDITYDVETTFQHKIFVDNAEWDLTQKREGVVSLPASRTGDSSQLKFYGEYTDIDVAVAARDYLGDAADGETKATVRTAIEFKFSNGSEAKFSACYDKDGNLYGIQSVGGLYKYKWLYQPMSAEEKAAYQNADEGIDFRVVRAGTDIFLYLDGKRVCDAVDLTYDRDGNSTGITESTTATVSIRQYGNIVDESVTIPFSMTTDIPEKGTITVSDEPISNGTINVYRKYLVGDSLVLTTTGDSGYYYDSLTIDGKDTMLDWDGTHTIETTKTSYEITGSFAERTFKDCISDNYNSSVDWNFTNQNMGVLAPQNKDGDTWWVETLKNTYRDVSVIVSDQSASGEVFKMHVNVTFSDNVTYKVRIDNEDGAYRVQNANGTINPNWKPACEIKSDDITKLKDKGGIEFRIAVIGTTIKIYLDGTERASVDASASIDSKETATISMRMYGNNGKNIEIPYTLGGQPQTATFDKQITGSGDITLDKDSYIVGEKVTLTVAGESGYYYDSLIVNDEDVTVNNDGTYTFIAQEENAIATNFAASIFKTNQLAYWNIINQHKGTIVQRNDWSTVETDDPEGNLDFSGTHMNSDVSVTVKASADDFNADGTLKDTSGNRTLIGYWRSGYGGKNPGFSIVLHTDGKYYVGHAGNQGYDNSIYELNEEETKKITEGNGIELRVIREGTIANIYLDGKLVYTYTLSYKETEAITVFISHLYDALTQQEIPYTFASLGTEKVTRSDMTISTDGNGTVTTDKATNDTITDKTYVIREKVTLTATGKDGYYCNSLTVNGEEVQPNWDGTYTFTASEKDEVYATFAEGPFADNGSNWNLSRQNYGVLVPNYADGANSGWIDAEGNYTELSMNVKDYLGKANSGTENKEFSVVGKFIFDNEKWAAVRIINDGGTYKITQYGSTKDPNAMSSWGGICTWDQINEKKLLGEDTAEKLAKIETDGIQFKLIRSGASIEIWLADTLLETLEFDGITAGNVVTMASIRHYGNPTTDTTTYEVELPYSLVGINPVTMNLVKDEHGVVTTNADNYFVGDTVTATVSPDAGYVIDRLKVNGSEVALNKKGTYTFEATDEIYELEPVFNRKIFVDDTAEWNVANQYNGSITSNSDGNSPWLYTYDYYRDIDLTVTAKDLLPDAQNYRLAIRFAFENGKNFTVSITNDADDNDTDYDIQHMGDSVGAWTCPFETLDETLVAALQGDGLKFRVVRTGTTADIYLGETQVCTGIDLTQNGTTGITADMKATVGIRHYGNAEKTIEIPFEFGTSTDVVELHDTDLFYANNKYTEGTDPFVLDNTAVDGYYYMYSTQGACYCYRSKDMMNWEYVGDALNYNSKTGISGMLLEDIWAPEVVYDAEEDLYYMFFSATPTADKATANQVLFVATSKYPYKGFELVDFTDESSCGDGNAHNYDTSTYSLDCAKYLMLDPAKYDAFSDKDGGYLGAIDPHPYVDVDENGNATKYLFWVDSRNEDRICGVQMENWLKPIWETATVLTAHGYYTVDEWESGADKNVDYELEDKDVTINEGPVITKHNGRYYLTFSVNAYAKDTYQVAQAVTAYGAKSPLDKDAPYRKLTEAEGGLLLSAKAAGSEKVSGVGHHSFVKVGDQMYIVYHRHNDVALMGSARNHAIDEVKWLTIKDKDENDLEVMYVNGPTSTVQPKIEAFSAYKNIAGEATVTGSGDSTCLTDGLVSIKGNTDFMAYVSKLTLTADAEYTFTFDESRTVRAVMVYNSGNATFTSASVKYVCEENGKEVTYTKNLAFDENASNTEPGAAAYATLHGYNVKKVIVTVNVPSGTASISEIKILGK